MTISTTTAKSRYGGDGSTTSFPTGFKFIANEHVRVLLQGADGSETVWAEGSEYSLTGAGAPGGGTVAVSTSPVDHTPGAGETLVVKLAVPAQQETSLPLGGAFPSTAVEAMADLAALRDQQIGEALSRAPKLKETTALADVAFPEPEAGRPIGWNAAGDALSNLEAIGRWQGDWTTGTDYVALDVVREPTTKNIYVCEAAHGSGSFATDLAAGEWSLAIEVEAVETAKTAAETAQAAAEAAQAAAETAEANVGTAQAVTAMAAAAAAASETNADNSATAAADSASTAVGSASAAQTAEINAESAAVAAAASAAQVESTKLVWRGDWLNTTYAVNDAVAHDGASWLCIQSHSNQQPPNATFWDVLAAKGDPGNDGADGLGVPPGGAAGQVLRKVSGIDNHTEWGNAAAAPVDSVFGRTGAVVAASGDYNAGQISETTGAKIMTSAERTKLSGIAAGAEANPGVPTQNQAEDGSNTTEYSWTPQWVHQAAKDAVPWSLTVAVGDETTALETGTGKIAFRLPHAVTLTAVRASLTTASSSGAVTVDINEGGTTILSTKLTLDQGEKTSTTAATAAVISNSALADDAEITVDVDGADGSAAGLKVTLIGYKTTT